MRTKTEIKGRYSLTRIFLAICTCGLSLPFAGIRKRTTIITITRAPIAAAPPVVQAR